MEENNKLIRKKIIENLIIIVAIIIYFFAINVLYIKIDKELFFNSIKIISLAILFIAIVLFEIAYRKDNGKIAIIGIEILIVAINTLLAWNIIYKNNISLGKYIIFSAIFWVTYYGLKLMIIYTKEKRKYLNSLSDIHEIVKKEPIKKEAKKRKD